MDKSRLADEMRIDAEIEMVRPELERLLKEKRKELRKAEREILSIASDEDETEYRHFLSLWTEKREDEKQYEELGRLLVSEFPDKVMNLIWSVRSFLRQRAERAAAELKAMADRPYFDLVDELTRRAAELGASCEVLEQLLR